MSDKACGVVTWDQGGGSFFNFGIPKPNDKGDWSGRMQMVYFCGARLGRFSSYNLSFILYIYTWYQLMLLVRALEYGLFDLIRIPMGCVCCSFVSWKIVKDMFAWLGVPKTVGAIVARNDVASEKYGLLEHPNSNRKGQAEWHACQISDGVNVWEGNHPTMISFSLRGHFPRGCLAFESIVHSKVSWFQLPILDPLLDSICS